MSSEEIKYESLHRASSETDSVQYHTAESGRSRWKNALSIICIIFLVVTNGVWIGLYSQQRHLRVNNRYPGYNGPTVSVPYFRSTPYSGDENLEVTSDLWTNLYPPGYGSIVVDSKWAIDNHLPTAKQNSSGGQPIYTVAAFHQLHCVTVLRNSLIRYKNGYGGQDWYHIRHCLDALRQLTMCSADSTPDMDGVHHECRDWDGLKQWTADRAYVVSSD